METKKIPNSLRAMRRVRRLRLEDVSKGTGIDSGNLSRLERGLLRPSSRRVRQLTRYFKIPFKVLFPGLEDNKGK